MNTLSSTSIATKTASIASISITSTPISLKDNNQGSIALPYNLVFHACTKHIDIYHYYICD